MKKTFYLMLILCTASLSGQGFMSKIYCRILGNTDAKTEFKDLAYTALKELGVTNAQNVPIKKMNAVGPVVASMPLSSFTAFGIWLDEQYLDACSPDEKKFHIYHEASHYAHKHHQKVLAWTGGASLIALGGLTYLYKNSDPYSLAITAATGALAAVSIYAGLLPRIVKQQEKEADLEAARSLIKAGSAHIVQSHLHNLDVSDDNSSLWWPSDKEQIEYLKPLLKE